MTGTFPRKKRLQQKFIENAKIAGVKNCKNRGFVFKFYIFAKNGQFCRFVPKIIAKSDSSQLITLANAHLTMQSVVFEKSTFLTPEKWQKIN